MYTIEEKVSKRGNLLIIGKFDNLNKAKSNFSNLCIMNCNKMVRLVTPDGVILDDTSNDSHIFFQ